MIRRVTFDFRRCAAFMGLVGALSVGFLVAANAPGAVEVEKQKESDWIDARWNNTDVGSFLSSLVDLPGGSPSKGLSIRAGTDEEATVIYDTANGMWRAGWTGGFLKFSGTRYGLMDNPKPAGTIHVVIPPSSPNTNASVQWRGMHVHERRVVLEYLVDGTKVLETPGYESAAGGLFTRTFEFAPGPRISLTLQAGKSSGFKVATNAGIAIAAGLGNHAVCAMRVEPGVGFQVENGTLNLTVESRKNTARIKLFLTSQGDDSSSLAAAIRQSPGPEDLAELVKAGPSRWKPLTTRGQRGFGSEAFVVDTLTIPYENPWKALFFTSGVDFLPNGDAAVCTIHGDVWLVSGIDDALQRLTWRRFATGLFQPLGLRVRDGKVFVLGRDQITELHDENADGEADYYENFFNGIRTTPGHDYVTSLELDTNRNFYYVDPRGVHRVSPDGARRETIATGWRNPNGMGASPDGSIVTVAPQEGEWTPSSAISEAHPGGWYGYGGPRISADRPLGYDPQLCWIPHSVDNSGGSQLWITSDKWQPLQGHMIHFSYGRCSQFLVLREVVEGLPQGAVTPLPGKFLSGAMRGAFNPKDGQLYVVGSTGWQTSAVRDGCLQRVRFTGANPLLPIECHVHSNGFILNFTTPLERTAAEDKGSYGLSQWNYRYAQQYGSRDWSVSNSKKEGHDSLEVKSAHLLPDGHSVFLEVPRLGPVMQYEIKYSLNSSSGKAMRSTIWGTINRLGAPF